MNLLELELKEETAAPLFAAFLKSADRKIRKEMASYFRDKPGPKLEMKVLSPYKAKITLEFQNYMDASSIYWADQDFKDAISHADANGHIHELKMGNSDAPDEKPKHPDVPDFVQAVIGSLRPGHSVVAEAFFATLEYEVTFKQIVSRKG